MENQRINSTLIDNINDNIINQQRKEKERLIKEAEKDDKSESVDFSKLLIDGIAKASAEVLTKPEIIESSSMLINAGIPKTCLEPLINIIYKSIINIVYNSILLYDDLLKDEIQKQLDHIGNHINLSKADIEAIKAVIQIHSKDLSSIKESLEINKFKSENGIS